MKKREGTLEVPFFFERLFSLTEGRASSGIMADYSKKDDGDIIKLILDGEVNAYEELVIRYEKMLYNLAYSKLRNHETAMDISQECFFKAYKALESYRFASSFSTWIYRICNNLIMDYLRKNSRNDILPLDSTEYSIPDTSNDPQKIILERERVVQVREAIAALPEDYREVILMRDISGFSYAQIADMLDIELSAVKSRISRARTNLKEILLQNSELF